MKAIKAVTLHSHVFFFFFFFLSLQANFAQVNIPANFMAPAEHDLGMLGTDPPAHDVTADRVVILNTKQIRIENLNYDGTAPGEFC